MAMINVGEADFDALARAAIEAERRGDIKEAHALDKIARKINLALSTTALSPAARYMSGPRPKRSWRDMPSVLGQVKL